MNEEHLSQLRAQEQQAYEKLQQKFPEKLIRPIPNDPQTVLTKIGISHLPSRPKGFIRYHHQDFIVEEVQPEGISTIEPTPHAPVQDQDPTIYAELVKIGLGTLEAIQELAADLDIQPTSIGYAGMKDGRAITSQQISIRRTNQEKISQLPKRQYFLKTKRSGKGAVAPGQLQGNRFTILVRSAKSLSSTELTRETDSLAQNGFPNFYGVQRFGNRHINAHLGQLLCRGEIDDAIRSYLLDPGPNDIPIHQLIRNKAAQSYPHWQQMKASFDILPYTFRHERRLLNALIAHSGEPRALYEIQDQVKFWVYGYAAFLVNELLSDTYAGKTDLPAKLPQPFGGEWSDDIYGQQLQRDHTQQYAKHLKRFPFLRQKMRTLDAWIIPQVHQAIPIEAGAIFSFTLPKGVYATTFLMFLFQLYEGTPIPDWVNPEEVDTKQALGIGSNSKAMEQLVIPENKQLSPPASPKV